VLSRGCKGRKVGSARSIAREEGKRSGSGGGRRTSGQEGGKRKEEIELERVEKRLKRCRR